MFVLSVCPLVTAMYCAKTTGIELPFGVLCWVSPSNGVLDGVLIPP